MSVVLLLIISTVSYTMSTLADAHEQVKQDITDFSRGAYDILIRPPDVRTELEKRLNLIEENYLGIGDGGITIEEWQDIKNNPQVELAAPVASIGLFTARERTWMIEKSKQYPKYFEVVNYTSDGVNTYENKDDIYLYDFGIDNLDLSVFPSSLSVDRDYLGYEADIATFVFPTSYHQVVAVDPTEEEKLTGYNLDKLTKKVMDPMAYKGGQYSIPIMGLKDIQVPVSFQLTIDDLGDISEEELMTWEDKLIGGSAHRTLYENPSSYYKFLEQYISKKRLHQEKVLELVPDDGLSPFEENLLYIDENMKLSSQGDMLSEEPGLLGGGHKIHGQRIGYRLSPVVYDWKDGNLSVKQTGIDEQFQAPTYRNIDMVEFYKLDEYNNATNDDDFVGFIENGKFSIKENAESLASAPLGIYGREMPHLASNPTVKLHPSAVPGSFITTPAHGLISIDYAEKIKGEAPIDAIRIKVAGITGYDKEAASLIRKLAKEWEDEGFTVDIVAGASVQDITVDVEGVGKVVQPFTTLGAADTVLSSWNMLQVAITILYGLVALTFIGFTFFNLLADRQKDEKLLARLGWSEKLIRQIRYKEGLLMIAPPIILVNVGFAIFGIWTGQWLPLTLTAVISSICILLFFLADRLQNKQQKIVKRQRKSMTFQNIWFYRFYLLASCIQLLLTTILTCFLPFFLLQHVETTTKTRLGTYVHGEIEGMFIFIIILLYVLSLTTVYQSLSRLWRKRAPEIQLFLYLGWEAKAIRTYFLREILFWAGVAAIFGWIVSLLFTTMMVPITAQTIIYGIVGWILILVIMLSGSIYSLHRAQVKGGKSIANSAS